MSYDSGSDNSLVSVVIPCYNRAPLIPRAVSSVQAQNYGNVEIILIDDGSSDDTMQVAARLRAEDPRVRYIRHERNKGEGGARNTGIRESQGEFIAFLDSDDEWLPGKLHMQVSALIDASAVIAGVAARHLLVDENGVETPVVDWTDRKPITCINLLAKGCGLSMGNTLLVRRSAFLDVGYCDENLPLFVDLDWLCRLTQRYEVKMLPPVVARYYKAPMRRGEFVESAVLMFRTKNSRLLKTFSLIDRLRIRSRFYNYISLAYAANGPWHRFIVFRTLHFLFNPFQHPGNYFHFLLALIGFVPIGKRA